MDQKYQILQGVNWIKNSLGNGLNQNNGIDLSPEQSNDKEN